MPSLADLIRMGKQYIGDAMPGGSLNPETAPVARQANYLSGILDPASQVSQDATNWHKRTQIGLKDQLAGRQTPEAEQAYQTMMMAAGMAPIGMTAWHGSPHKFDKFSLDKIGTGEGAQAYGHGLYLAESPEVAQTYKQSAEWRQKTMDQMKYLVDGKEIMPKGVDDGLLYHYRMSAPDLFEERIAHLKKQHQGSLDQAAYYAEQAKLGDDADRYARMAARSNDTANRFAGELALAERLKSQKVEAATGQLYKTDIPDEAVARFLDWDKPLSQQAPEVRDALAAIKAKQAESLGVARFANPAKALEYKLATKPLPDDMSGESIYRFLGNNHQDATELLRQQGIPGIRYLDGGSRSAGQGSSNFVAFDPEMIRILERNGQATGAKPWAPGEYRLKDLIGKE